MDILERRDALTRTRRTLKKWRPRPNTGSLTKDILFLLIIGFIQITILPYLFGSLGYLDLITPWLVITFIRQRPLQAHILALVGALILETRLAVPAGLYICAYWILANVISLVRPALSWRYKTPWLVSYALASLWVILFEVFVINFLQTASLHQPAYIAQQVVRFIVTVSYGMYLSREWMTIDAEEPVPQ
ncbi:MAG TPA: hypothetical protein VE954_17320 [Oligoflexus sp.]|uniref:hypothetical protein n=1 Tax=Oligoflexus sp. TaxID=1971216 RepID=UPI002D5736C3|nr:hypothetical protein [Oligoflexus sp.]HYX34861.1 hypothetical protein [Oligoflexus sp.]